MSTRICQGCGSELTGDVRFCPKCGRAVEKQVCQNCGAVLTEGARFCRICGKEIPSRFCPKCGTENPSTNKFCQRCGTPLSPVLSSPATSRPSAPAKPQKDTTTALEIHQKKVKKIVRVTNIVIVTLVIIGIPLYLFFGPPNLINKLGVEKSVEQGISRDDAVTLATRRVQEDGVMSLSGRETAVKEETEHWHISFPISAPNVFGGEPHVIIDKASGAITRVYYTQ